MILSYTRNEDGTTTERVTDELTGIVIREEILPPSETPLKDYKDFIPE